MQFIFELFSLMLFSAMFIAPGVSRLIEIQESWINPNGLYENFEQTLLNDDSFIIQWMFLNESLSDLWCVSWNYTANQFAQLIAESLNIADNGSWIWQLYLEDTQLAANDQYLFLFKPPNIPPTEYNENTGWIPSRGFLITEQPDQYESPSLASSSTTASSTAGSSTTSSSMISFFTVSSATTISAPTSSSTAIVTLTATVLPPPTTSTASSIPLLTTSPTLSLNPPSMTSSDSGKNINSTYVSLSPTYATEQRTSSTVVSTDGPQTTTASAERHRESAKKFAIGIGAGIGGLALLALSATALGMRRWVNSSVDNANNNINKPYPYSPDRTDFGPLGLGLYELHVNSPRYELGVNTPRHEMFVNTPRHEFHMATPRPELPADTINRYSRGGRWLGFLGSVKSNAVDIAER